MKLVIGMKNNLGFTLIEIMIVIVIIGITVGFALIAFGDFGESKRILFAAEHLVNNLRLAQQEAILETNTLGLRIDNKSYQILQLQNNSKWSPMSNKGIFKTTNFPQNTVITLITKNHPGARKPSIIILASGDMTPFTLNFGSNKEDKLASLIGSRNGDLKFKVVNSQ
ncbi:type II secretion system minor pseudopilin GspH [Legionella sp.]|uniref:type II secretion system minor pseudopilin GspH n=1 Tax=Legionella sp. TaxID=459 RepID=UPI003CC0F57C